VPVTRDLERSATDLANRLLRKPVASAATAAFLLTFVILVWSAPRSAPDVGPVGPTSELIVPDEAPQPSSADVAAPEAPVEPDPAPAAEPTEPAPEPVAPAEPEPEPQPAPAAEPPQDRRPAPGPGAALYDRTYRTIHLRQGDERVTVAGGQPLFVRIDRGPEGTRLRWATACATTTAALTIDEQRWTVVTGEPASGCEVERREDDDPEEREREQERLDEQERWLTEFLAASPRWRQVGGQLRLWTDEGHRIDLRTDDPAPDAA
jgi:hypothetical protein